MSAPKAGTYLLAGSVFYRVEGEGAEATRRRYKRGDRVKLSKAEAARLAVPSRLAPATFVEVDDDDGDIAPGADLVTSPPLVVNRTSEANQLIAEANTGLITVTDGAGQLTAEQVEENTEIVGFPAVTGAGAGDLVPTGDLDGTGDGPPARSALVEVWRQYAVKVEAVTEAESGDMTKPQLQEAVARKQAAG